MITKITESNKQFYNALFQDINSSIAGLNIQTLEDYFRNLVQIGQYVNGSDSMGRKDYFMRLPADEEIFQINANTRVINVPAAFRSNGIAVVGDQYAETLWFKIDKYYDIQDLGAENVRIRIYWEQPGTKIAGYSVPQYHDVWSEAGQLYFGWVIPGIITQNAGNLVFSIRFDAGETSNNPDYIYSTLPQTLKINDTPFKANKTYEIDSTDRTAIFGRLTNSTSSAIYVPKPIFSHEISATYEYIPAGGNVLRAAAYSERRDGLEIEYYWYVGGNRISEGVEVDWIKTTDTEINTNKYYYNDQGVKYNDDEDLKAALVAGTDVYEKGSKITIAAPGSYQVKAIAKYTYDDEDKGETIVYSRPEFSNVIYFELPTPIQSEDITFESSLNGIIGDGEDAKPIITFACDMGSGQQSHATCDVKLYVGNESLVETYLDVANDAVNYEATEEGDYYVKAVKKLNGISTDTYTSNKINIQRQAVMATADPVETLISAGSSVTFTYANNNVDNHIYKYVLYYSPTSTVDNTNSVYGRWETAPASVQLTKSGSYKMYVQSIYGRSVETYTESPTIIAWTI